MFLGVYKDLPIKRKRTAIILATSAVGLLLAGSAFLAYEVNNSRRFRARRLFNEDISP